MLQNASDVAVQVADELLHADAIEVKCAWLGRKSGPGVAYSLLGGALWLSVGAVYPVSMAAAAAVGAAALAILVASQASTSVVSIDRAGLHLRHHPLPWFTRHLRLSQLARLELEPTSRGGVDQLRLVARLRDGSSQVLAGTVLDVHNRYHFERLAQAVEILRPRAEDGPLPLERVSDADSIRFTRSGWRGWELRIDADSVSFRQRRGRPVTVDSDAVARCRVEYAQGWRLVLERRRGEPIWLGPWDDERVPEAIASELRSRYRLG